MSSSTNANASPVTNSDPITAPAATATKSKFKLPPEIIILQMSVIGIIAVGVNLVIITGGIDLSSGSVVAAAAVVSASLAQVSDFPRAIFPQLTDLPAYWPILAGTMVGLIIGLMNGSLIAYTAIPPFIATLGLMVAARGFAKWFTGGMPVSMLTPEFAWIGEGGNPVVIFLVIACICLYLNES